jgi:HKD family nuclease
VLASVAYLREDGLAAVESSIKPAAEHTIVFAGIRNDLTSIQAVKRLLALNVQLYAVDTATRRSIYHPKLYVVANETEARVVVGSANLTFGGMYNNIEISALMNLDCSNKDDAKFLDDVKHA